MHLPLFVFGSLPLSLLLSDFLYLCGRFKKRVLIQQLETALTEVEEEHTTSLQLPNDHGS